MGLEMSHDREEIEYRLPAKFELSFEINFGVGREFIRMKGTLIKTNLTLIRMTKSITRCH